MDKEVISVIIPLYKGTCYIPYWINKLAKNAEILRNQSNAYLSVVMVNDFPEEFVDIDDFPAGELSVEIYNSDVNRGIHGARVFGLLKAKGRYITFLDQDDEIADDYFFKQYSMIGDSDVVICNAYFEEYCSEGLYRYYASEEAMREKLNLKSFLGERNQIISPGQALIRSMVRTCCQH